MAGVAGSCGFNGRVQREEIGSLCDGRVGCDHIRPSLDMSGHIAQLPRQLTASPGELGGYFLRRVVVKLALSGQLNKTVKLLIIKSTRALDRA